MTRTPRIQLRRGDARDLSWIPDASVHLVVTSPPYWNLKEYRDGAGQMGHIDDYAQFLGELDRVWRHAYRVLVPGGRLVCVVGDVCLARKEHGRHLVVPLHADIVVRCREAGFDNLNPILWYKVANIDYEGEGAGILGKPYEPNAIIKSDVEYILLQRKPGGYRSPTEEQRQRSRISKTNFTEWFQQLWRISGATDPVHPAPFPLVLADRLVRMFSFWGDTVLDPFAGTGTTLLAAARADRDAIGVEVDPVYFDLAVRTARSAGDLFLQPVVEVSSPGSPLRPLGHG